MDRDQKRSEVAELKETFAGASTAVVLEFKGLTVVKDTAFRKSIRDSKGQYRVAKNTLLRLAVKETAFESLAGQFNGNSAVATTHEDIIGLAKAIQTFLKENPAATLKAAIMDGKAVSAAEFQAIAELPSRETLIGKLLFLMQYPIQGLAVALDAIRKQKEESAA
jgi:large subunit ribosomal protein L10